MCLLVNVREALPSEAKLLSQPRGLDGPKTVFAGLGGDSPSLWKTLVLVLP